MEMTSAGAGNATWPGGRCARRAAVGAAAGFAASGAPASGPAARGHLDEAMTAASRGIRLWAVELRRTPWR